MDRSLAKCPGWLERKITKEGGIISFYHFMDLALNDAHHGAYASGCLTIGKKGDFATSPSLGSNFADLLAVQIAEWLENLKLDNIIECNYSLIDFGPGEGHLSKDLIEALNKINPSLIENLELVLIEPNKGMRYRQKKYLESLKIIRYRWCSIEDLINNPVNGIIIAHEILDTLPVERIILKKEKIFRQGVKLSIENQTSFISFNELPLTSSLEKSIEFINECHGVLIPPIDAEEGWCTEIHEGMEDWFYFASKILKNGILLVIDYALEAERYYKSSRNRGTIVSYCNQVMSSELLNNAGNCDITAHLCTDTLKTAATNNKWSFLGERRQGQALLALGLSQKLYSLQFIPQENISEALEQREVLLRLVDPSCLGDFRWLAFYKSSTSINSISTKFLLDPVN